MARASSINSIGIPFLIGNATAADSEINSEEFLSNLSGFLLIGHTKQLNSAF